MHCLAQGSSLLEGPGARGSEDSTPTSSMRQRGSESMAFGPESPSQPVNTNGFPGGGSEFSTGRI